MNKFLIKKPYLSYQRMVNPRHSRQWKVFLISFFLLATLGISGSYFLDKKIQALLGANDQQIEQEFNDLKNSYLKKLSNTEKSAPILLFEGIDLIKKNQVELGLITLEKAVEKDPNWRDSALYTGYTYLRWTQEFPIFNFQFSNKFSIQNSQFKIDDYLQKSKYYLEKARDIDPLYAKTHQYLVILYNQLGDQQNSQLSLKKIQDFSTP